MHNNRFLSLSENISSPKYLLRYVILMYAMCKVDNNWTMGTVEACKDLNIKLNRLN